jgi:hypothetical protein
MTPSANIPRRWERLACEFSFGSLPYRLALLQLPAAKSCCADQGRGRLAERLGR